MLLYTYITLVFSILHYSTTVNANVINLVTGNIIHCKMEGKPRVFYNAVHALFVYNSTHIIHEIVHSDVGYIELERFSVLIASKYKECEDVTDTYDNLMYDKGVKPRDKSVAAFAAATDVGRSVVYDLYSCNSQHWVTSWKYGKAFSMQSNQSPSFCDLKNLFDTDFESGQISSGNGDGKGFVNVFKKSFAIGPVAVKVSGPSFSSESRYHGGNYGFGVTASLFDTRVQYEDAAGVSFGLRSDTRIQMGKNGLELYVLGVGLSLTDTDQKFCIIFCCIYI